MLIKQMDEIELESGGVCPVDLPERPLFASRCSVLSGATIRRRRPRLRNSPRCAMTPVLNCSSSPFDINDSHKPQRRNLSRLQCACLGTWATFPLSFCDEGLRHNVHVQPSSD
ncbi:hypothetical protein CONLIGDRAFT_377902 [Coniochaeta ligniaria NRRL 30616]|uniref:Uncharacterized protein n=1 Tax=Coniochaeta ligniaria NRRL 30616 TaxID=1408157 RepID=A0A1J7J588_9PEZI|nr:hypothetical protein CONLIGDRAFT_377902 [Coniochaeta ligniaria NRRL 30616]